MAWRAVGTVDMLSHTLAGRVPGVHKASRLSVLVQICVALDEARKTHPIERTRVDGHGAPTQPSSLLFLNK